jgi:hypothetical protein
VDDVLFRCRVRGTTREGDRVRVSPNWAFARRDDLILTSSEMRCGDWSIPYAEIDDGLLVSIPLRWGLGEQRRLLVSGRGKVYQFILPVVSIWKWKLEVDPFWDAQLPFPVRREKRAYELRSVVLLIMVYLMLTLWLALSRG